MTAGAVITRFRVCFGGTRFELNHLGLAPILLFQCVNPVHTRKWDRFLERDKQVIQLTVVCDYLPIVAEHPTMKAERPLGASSAKLVAHPLTAANRSGCFQPLQGWRGR